MKNTCFISVFILIFLSQCWKNIDPFSPKNHSSIARSAQLETPLKTIANGKLKFPSLHCLLVNFGMFQNYTKVDRKKWRMQAS